MRDDVLIIIRSVGERTEKVCHEIACDQVGKDNVIIIHEKPFWKAVRKTFELGVSSNKKWTLALDADVLLCKNGVREMIKRANKFKPNLFIYQGQVSDKIFGINRSGGPHLYFTKNLENALSVENIDINELRPESLVHREMKSRFGLKKVVDKNVYGIHDYWQTNFDYYRKCYLHGKKHTHYAGQFFQNNIKYYSRDISYQSMLKGWIYALETDDQIEIDIDFLSRKLKSDFDKLNISENGKEIPLNLEEVYFLIDTEIRRIDESNLRRTSPLLKKILVRIKRVINGRI